MRKYLILIAAAIFALSMVHTAEASCRNPSDVTISQAATIQALQFLKDFQVRADEQLQRIKLERKHLESELKQKLVDEKGLYADLKHQMKQMHKLEQKAVEEIMTRAYAVVGAQCKQYVNIQAQKLAEQFIVQFGPKFESLLDENIQLLFPLMYQVSIGASLIP